MTKIIQQIFIDWLINNDIYDKFVNVCNNTEWNKRKKIYNIYDYLNKTYYYVYIFSISWIYNKNIKWKYLDDTWQDYIKKNIKYVCKLDKI